LVLTNQAEFEQKLVEVMRTKKGALQVLELLAKLNREIGSRADEAPAVRIVIGGNIPLDGMRAVTRPALSVPTDPAQSPIRELAASARVGVGSGRFSDRDRDDLLEAELLRTRGGHSSPPG
jgi:hypothetical protein